MAVALLLVLSLAAAKKPGRVGFLGYGLRGQRSRLVSSSFAGFWRLGVVYPLLWFLGWADEVEIGD